MLSVLLDIFKREGILGWYRGFSATMLNTFSMRAPPPTIPSDSRPTRLQNTPTFSSTPFSAPPTSNASPREPLPVLKHPYCPPLPSWPSAPQPEPSPKSSPFPSRSSQPDSKSAVRHALNTPAKAPYLKPTPAPTVMTIRSLALRERSSVTKA